MNVTLTLKLDDFHIFTIKNNIKETKALIYFAYMRNLVYRLQIITLGSKFEFFKSQHTNRGREEKD